MEQGTGPDATLRRTDTAVERSRRDCQKKGQHKQINRVPVTAATHSDSHEKARKHQGRQLWAAGSRREDRRTTDRYGLGLTTRLTLRGHAKRAEMPQTKTPKYRHGDPARFDIGPAQPLRRSRVRLRKEAAKSDDQP